MRKVNRKRRIIRQKNISLQTKKKRLMTTIDIIILFIISIGILLGLVKGALKQLAGLLGLIVGLLAAKALYATVATQEFSHVTHNMTVAQLLGFLTIWVIVPLLFWGVACLLTKALDVVCLGWINRLLGGVLGGMVHALLVSLLICVLEAVDTKSDLISKGQKQESILYYRMEPLVGLFFPAAKEFTEQIYNEINDATERI